ncbi:MAG: hypothetical protein HY288_20450 [Planctomycetia bacterium]|nr:hypothetical protein [Planctomycetia bacterium]
MPKTNLAVRRPVAPAGWHSRACLAALGLVALATLSGGAACLWYHAHVAGPQHVLGPAGIIFLVSGLMQLRIATIAWRAGRLAARQNSGPVLRSWRLFLAGAFLAYVAALAIGPAEYIGCAWLAAVAAWYTMLLLPLAASPRVLEGWRKWTQGRTPRRLSWLVTVSILLVVFAEAGLQTCKYANPYGWIGCLTARSIVAQGLQINSTAEGHTAAMSRIGRFTPGPFRVAVVGDKAALRGAEHQGYLARVEQMLPGLKLAPLGIPVTWSRVDVNVPLTAFRPDLVLAVVSVCEDLTYEPGRTTWFDWRQLELPRWFTTNGEPARAIDHALRPSSSGGDLESFLRALGPQLAACRTPIDQTMRARWQEAFTHLDRLLESCQRQQIPLALVVVPGEFQVNRGLCATLTRRMGYTAEQFDVDLPQRRIAGFADHRKLPLVDLLPYLRLCRQSPYEPNDTAWNEQGNAVAASAIGGWLESRYGGQLASAAQLSSAP